MKKITTLVILILLLNLLAACVEALPPTPTPTPTPLPLDERVKKRVEEEWANFRTKFTQLLETLKFWKTSKTPSERITGPPSGSGLTIGKPAIVDNTRGQGLRCRTSPDTKDSSNIVTKLMDGTEVEVIDGPISKPDYTWWKVKTPGDGSCWVAAGDWLHPIPAATPAVTAQPVCTEGRAVDRDFFVEVLEQLGIPVTSFALDALEAWEPHENTSACWNPLATTWKMSGSWYLNCFEGQWKPGCQGDMQECCLRGVQHYPDRSTGIQATAKTLNLGHYDAIREMLRQESFDRDGLIRALNTWRTGPGPVGEWKKLWDARSD